MTASTQIFNDGTSTATVDEVEVRTDADRDAELVSLADAAQEASGYLVETATQEPLDGTDTLKIKFVGVSFDSIDMDLKIGTEMAFLVTGRVVGRSEEESKRDHMLRHTAKFEVGSVTIHEG